MKKRLFSCHPLFETTAVLSMSSLTVACCIPRFCLFTLNLPQDAKDHYTSFLRRRRPLGLRAGSNRKA